MRHAERRSATVTQPLLPLLQEGTWRGEPPCDPRTHTDGRTHTQSARSPVTKIYRSMLTMATSPALSNMAC